MDKECYNNVSIRGKINSIDIKQATKDTFAELTIKTNDGFYLVQCWDLSFVQVKNLPLQVGDNVYVEGYLHTYKKDLISKDGKKKLERRWLIKAKNIRRDNSRCKIRGVITNVNNSRNHVDGEICFCIKPFIINNSNVIYCNAHQNFNNQNYIVKDRAIEVEGALSIKDGRVKVDVDKMLWV